MAQHKPQSNQRNPHFALSWWQIAYFLTSRTWQSQAVYPAHLLLLMGIAIFIARLMSDDSGGASLWAIFTVLALLTAADLWLLIKNKNSTTQTPFLVGGVVLLVLSIAVATGNDVILPWAALAILYSGLRLVLN